MKLYLLSLRDNPVGHDYYNAKVVIAENKKDARKIANEYTGNEDKIWEDKKKVTCKRLKLNEENKRLVLSSFNAG